MKLKRSVKFIIPAVVVILIVVAVVVHALPKKKQTNSADAAGNTAGNLMNGGLFASTTIKFILPIHTTTIISTSWIPIAVMPVCSTPTAWHR